VVALAAAVVQAVAAGVGAVVVAAAAVVLSRLADLYSDSSETVWFWRITVETA
jgi:hypothetical protein